jgi:hypothetical protein
LAFNEFGDDRFFLNFGELSKGLGEGKPLANLSDRLLILLVQL